MRTPTNHQMYVLRLTRVVVVKEDFGLFGQEQLAVFAIIEFRFAGAERLDLGERWLCLDHSGHSIQAINELAVDRILDPKRAVLIEGGDTFLGRHQCWARWVCCGAREAWLVLPRLLI